MTARVVAVVGASADRSKFGNIAVRSFLRQGYHVYPVHPRDSEIEGIPAFPSVTAIPEGWLDWISLYLPQQPALNVLEEIARRGNFGELWLNPGADHPVVVQRAKELGLRIQLGCSIIASETHSASGD